MKKIWKRILSAVLAVCLAVVSLTPCFAEEAVNPLDDVQWGYIHGDREYDGFLYFILPADIQMGAQSVAFFKMEDDEQVYSGTMADFETRTLPDGGTLAMLCLPEKKSYMNFYFAEGAFVFADGTPSQAYTARSSVIGRSWELDMAFPSESLRIFSPEGKTLEGNTIRFSFSDMDELPEDLFTLEKVEKGTTSRLSDRMEITDGKAALVTTAVAGSATYIVRCNGKDLYKTDVQVLDDAAYKALLSKDNAVSRMVGTVMAPLLPVVAVAGFVGGFGAGLILGPVMAVAFLPAIAGAPILGPYLGVTTAQEWTQTWMDLIRHYYGVEK